MKKIENLKKIEKLKKTKIEKNREVVEVVKPEKTSRKRQPSKEHRGRERTRRRRVREKHSSTDKILHGLMKLKSRDVTKLVKDFKTRTRREKWEESVRSLCGGVQKKRKRMTRDWARKLGRFEN